MKLSQVKGDLRETLLKAWVDPDVAFAPMIGGEGYRLPPLADYCWIPLDQSKKEDRLTIEVGNGASNNWLVVPNNKIWTRPLHVQISAGVKNNVLISAGRESGLFGHIFLHSHGALIFLGDGIRQPSPINIRLWSRDHLLFWGDGCTTNGVKIVMQGADTRLIVGEDCMFAEDISIRTSDMHAIVDMSDGSHLNPAESVHIEPHVWVTQEVTILKGSKIGFGSVIGAQSLVTGEISRFSLAAGTPARVIRSNVSWDRREKPSLETVDRLQKISARLV